MPQHRARISPQPRCSPRAVGSESFALPFIIGGRKPGLNPKLFSPVDSENEFSICSWLTASLIGRSEPRNEQGRVRRTAAPSRSGGACALPRIVIDKSRFRHEGKCARNAAVAPDVQARGPSKPGRAWALQEAGGITCRARSGLLAP